MQHQYLCASHNGGSSGQEVPSCSGQLPGFAWISAFACIFALQLGPIYADGIFDANNQPGDYVWTRRKKVRIRYITCLKIFLNVYWGRILERNWDKSLKSFPPCYSQSPLRTDFIPPEQKWFETCMKCKHCVQEFQVLELSRLCP